MVARAQILGDTGANHPDHWVGGLASPDLHAIVILFAQSGRAGALPGVARAGASGTIRGQRALQLDLEAVPPFDYAHDHLVP
jgi:hypothetical protein